MSTNTTGASPTNPPAVMGREWESLIGAWIPPVDMPEGRGSGIFWGFSVDCWLRADCERARTPRELRATRRSRKTRLGGLGTGPALILETLPPPGASRAAVHPLGGFDRLGCFSEFARCHSASESRWIGRRIQGLGRSGRAYRSKRDSCRQSKRWRTADFWR